MKATREVFSKAAGPVMADVERQYPGLVHIVLEPDASEYEARLVARDGSGTGLYLGDGWDADVNAVLTLAELVQEA